MKFRARLELHGKTATGIEVPPDVVAALGGGKRPPVAVTINAHTYRTSIGSMGGKSLLPVSAQVRQDAGVSAGDELEVEVVLDEAPRTVDVPADLAAALAGDDAARSAFDALSYSHQLRHVQAIESAKTEQTRQRRVEKALADLRQH
jgi:Domain of unknown function (DUF1905)/Bacteriocin-protection, YdeI or OmpD-Associated